MQNKRYLSHWSAIKVYASHNIRKVFKKELEGNGLEHYTVFCRKDLHSKKGTFIHLCSTQIPSTHKFQIGEKNVLSPEIAFAQVASELDLHRLILLALLMCAQPEKPWQEALTTKANMIRTIKALKQLDGKAKALQALGYVEDSCRSPMEAFLFMLLSLPYKLGGYGLTGAVFNYEVRLNPKNAKTLRQWRVFADIYYRQGRLFVEYDSKEFHTEQAELQKDAERTASILRENYQLINVRTNQVFDKNKFEIVAHNLARCIGKRIRIKNRNQFILMHQRLRQLLLFY